MLSHYICSGRLKTAWKSELRGSAKNNRVDSYLLRRLTYTSEILHMHAMNCPAPEYAIIKTMQIIDCCCLATEECEITSCVHAGI